jgi:hypothetical protein
MMKKKQVRKSIINKKTEQLDTIGYGKSDIMWFWQWLKLAVDMEGQSIELSKKIWQTGSKNKQVRVAKTKSFLIKINEKALNGININELRRMKKIMNMDQKEIFKNFNIWFVKYKHLFEGYSVLYAKHRQDIIESNEYITVQIHKSMDRRTIDNQIEEIMKGLKLKDKELKKSSMSFFAGVKKDSLAKQWNVFKLKEEDVLSNQDIAQEVGYTKKKNSLNVHANKQLKGLRIVQKSYASAKCIIINVASGIFPKSTIE